MAAACVPLIPPELREVIKRVAGYPDGVQFFVEAPIDSVAVTLGIHPFVVDAARGYLQTPTGRADFASAPKTPAPEVDVINDCPGGEPEQLIRRARSGEPGVRFLLDGPVDEVAERFGVHPYTVFRARGMLARQNRI